MLLLPVLFGVLVYMGALSGGFLSDDYLVSRFVGDDGSILWGQAFSEFGGPWGGFEGELYRPLISLSLCLDLMLGGGGPASFHASNLLFHCISIFCVAWLCGRYSRERKGVLALLGGSLFALSPVGVEAVAWILGRTSSLEGALRLIALCGFTIWLEDRRPGRYALTAFFALAALLTKESAVVLPLAFLGLDLLRGGRGRALVQRQLLFVPIWILYAGLRINAISGGGARSAGDLFAALPGVLFDRVRSLFLPGIDSSVLAWGLLAFLLLFLVRISCSERDGRTPCARVTWPWLLVVLLLWSLQFLPSARNEVHAELSGSRILYGPLALTLVLLMAGLGLPARGLSLGLDRILTGLLFISLPFLGKATGDRVADYQRAWALVDGYRTELQARAPESSLDAPLTLLAAPADRWGITLLRADTMFSLLEPPFSRRSAPLFSLIPVLRELPEQKELFWDLLPVRSLWEHGATLLNWDGRQVSSEKKPRKPQSLELVRVSKRSFRFAHGPVNPYEFEGIQIKIGGDAQTLRLLLPDQANHASWQALELGPAVDPKVDGVAGGGDGGKSDAEPEPEKSRVHRMDLSHDYQPLIASLLGGVAGFELGGEGEILSLEIVGRYEKLADGLVPDQELTLDSEGQLSLRAPLLPEGAATLRFYLVGPYGGLSMDVDAGQPIRLEPSKAHVLRSFFLLGTQRSFYLLFEARPKPGHWPQQSPGTMVRIQPR